MPDDIEVVQPDRLQLLQDLGLRIEETKAVDITRTSSNKALKENFFELENTLVTVVGKIMLIRNIGRLSFAMIEDESEKIQLLFKEGDVKHDLSGLSNTPLSYENLHFIEVGDQIQAIGTLSRTKTGEISVMVSGYTLLF